MAEKEAKAPKSSKKELKPAALAVIDNLVFSKTEVWAYYRLSTDVFDFLSTDGKIAGAYQIANAFTNLIGDRKESLDIHIIESAVPIDIDAWAVQINEVTKEWNRSPGFDRYINEQISYLKQEEYLKKVVTLGVNIGKRGALDFDDVNFLELGVKGTKEQIGKWWNRALAIRGEEISADEEDNSRRKESEFFRTLANGNLQAKRMNSEDILLLIKRQMYPSMPTPYLDVTHDSRLGPGDMALETASAIENKYRWLKISQIIEGEEISGYRACLSFSKFPRYMGFPNGTFPFMYFPSKLSLPFTLYARLTLKPSEVMKKEIEKKKLQQADEIENVSAGATATGNVISGGMPTAVQEALEDVQTMTSILSSDKSPWVEGSYRIVVETPSEEILRKYCSIVKQRYADLDINVTWTAGDQAELFLEQMPGDSTRIKSFKQVTNLSFLATSGFRNSNDVGDLIFGSGEV